jgi:hypothetical protein
MSKYSNCKRCFGILKKKELNSIVITDFGEQKFCDDCLKQSIEKLKPIGIRL